MDSFFDALRVAVVVTVVVTVVVGLITILCFFLQSLRRLLRFFFESLPQAEKRITEHDREGPRRPSTPHESLSSNNNTSGDTPHERSSLSNGDTNGEDGDVRNEEQKSSRDGLEDPPRQPITEQNEIPSSSVTGGEEGGESKTRSKPDQSNSPTTIDTDEKDGVRPAYNPSNNPFGSLPDDPQEEDIPEPVHAGSQPPNNNTQTTQAVAAGPQPSNTAAPAGPWKMKPRDRPSSDASEDGGQPRRSSSNTGAIPPLGEQQTESGVAQTTPQNNGASTAQHRPSAHKQEAMNKPWRG